MYTCFTTSFFSACHSVSCPSCKVERREGGKGEEEGEGEGGGLKGKGWAFTSLSFSQEVVFGEFSLDVKWREKKEFFSAPFFFSRSLSQSVVVSLVGP